MRKYAKKKTSLKLVENDFRDGRLRPFSNSKLYYNKHLIERPSVGSIIFPDNLKNLAITIAGKGNRKGFVTLITDLLPDYNNFDGGCKYFPLYYYEEKETVQGSLFDGAAEGKYVRRDGVSDFILNRANKLYGKSVSKKDIFYYVYGLFHSPEYRETFANDLKKILPRLPLLDNPKDFGSFSKAGRELAELHLNYESVAPYDKVDIEGEESQNFKVQKMVFAKIKKEIDGKNKSVADKSVIHFNSSITIRDIPEKAYKYVVNGKPAIEWIMERYQITIDKKSGIKNNPNDWADEVGNPRYILDLLLSIINVSIQTIDIVEGLPKLEFE